MAKPRSKIETQFEQAQPAANRIVAIMQRAAEEMGTDLEQLRSILMQGNRDNSIIPHNWHVLHDIAVDASQFSMVAQRERHIIGAVPLGRPRKR
jgi:hypothetical protein